MKKKLTNIGGLILFYSVIIFGVLLLNIRFKQLNNINDCDLDSSYIAMNK